MMHSGFLWHDFDRESPIEAARANADQAGERDPPSKATCYPPMGYTGICPIIHLP